MEDIFNIKTSGSGIKIEENPTKKINANTISAFEDFGVEHSLDSLMNQINSRAALSNKKHISKDEVKELVGIEKDKSSEFTKTSKSDNNVLQGSAFDDFFDQSKTQPLIELISNKTDKWGRLLTKFKSGLMRKFYLSLLGSAIVKSENNTVTLSLKNDDFDDVVKYQDQIGKLEKLMSDASQRDIKVAFVRANKISEQSPRKLRQQIYENKCNETWEKMDKSEDVALLKQHFGAEIVKDYRFCLLPTESDLN